jgi:hypothetical protein
MCTGALNEGDVTRGKGERRIRTQLNGFIAPDGGTQRRSIARRAFQQVQGLKELEPVWVRQQP